MNTDYTPFILAILVTPSPVPLVKRIGINSISWPSIFHAAAWREYKQRTASMLPVVMKSIELMK